MSIQSEKAAHRLDVFVEAQVNDIRARIGTFRTAPWPRLEGCLAVLFTSRTGSTHLARELETVFDIGRMREWLNPGQLKGRAMAEIVTERREAWFAFKAGPLGVIAGETFGFFDAYLAKTAFILLARRDIVAQAVSLEKAVQSKRWHSTDTAKAGAVYDCAKIAASIGNIVVGVEQLRAYATASERPWRTLIYEDFADDDFAPALAACGSLGVPRRDPGSQIRPMPVERMGDVTNETWVARFRQEMDSRTRDLTERYLAGF